MFEISDADNGIALSPFSTVLFQISDTDDGIALNQFDRGGVGIELSAKKQDLIQSRDSPLHFYLAAIESLKSKVLKQEGNVCKAEHHHSPGTDCNYGW